MPRLAKDRWRGYAPIHGPSAGVWDAAAYNLDDRRCLPSAVNTSRYSFSAMESAAGDAWRSTQFLGRMEFRVAQRLEPFAQQITDRGRLQGRGRDPVS